MKKTIKTLVIAGGLLFASNFATGQDLTFGAKGGLNYSMLTGGVSDGNGLGFHVGGIASYDFSDKMGLRVELLFSTRALSSTEEIEIIDSKIKTSSTPSFVAIPVLFNYSFDKISLMAGPQFSILASYKAEVETTIASLDPVTAEVEGTDGLRSFSVDIALGAEYSVSDNMGVSLRYVRALQSLADSDNDDSRYNVIQLSAVYKF
ncbi:MAG: porin family protein [Wenyingzhuangia sp.]|uniref:porin family protein n=1 Tax=Wenyingzhuangia sp. TaxID=1964193 RepID=UPI00321AB5B4